MASQVKLARTLSKGEQKKALKGGKKVKKNVIKNTLDNPFALEWPSISSEVEEEVRVILEKSCLGLKKVICKPPWKEVQKYKGAERSAFLEKFKKEFQENLDPDSVRQNQETDEALSHVVFGYNAVMRALEQDRIAGIIVKKNVQPSFVVKTFLPGCASKCIPLFPLTDLDELLKNENTLVLPHSCMVLGLKPSVREEGNRFHALYLKMCEAVEIYPNGNDESDEELDESDEEEVGKGGEEEVEEEEMNMEQRKENLTVKDDGKKPLSILSQEEIKSFHLTRADSSQRAFVPGGEREQNATTADLGDFISFGNSDETPIPALERKQLVDRTPQQATDKKPKITRGSHSVSQASKNGGITSMFILDQEGEGSNMADGVKSKTEECAVKKPSNKKNIKMKKRKLEHDGSYIPAKSKRLQGNMNRKANPQK